MKKLVKPIIGFGAAIFMAGLFAGCRTGVNTVERANPVGTKLMVNDKRVIPNAALARSVAVVGVNEAPGEFLTIQVELQNTTRSVQNFAYYFEWYDGNGIQINLPTAAYSQKQIEPKESVFIKATAPTPNAKDFRLKLVNIIR